MLRKYTRHGVNGVKFYTRLLSQRKYPGNTPVDDSCYIPFVHVLSIISEKKVEGEVGSLYQ